MLSHSRASREEEPKAVPPRTNAGVPAGHEDVWGASWRPPSPARVPAGRRISAVTDRVIDVAPSRVVQWIRFWMQSHEYRRRRAYFRPRDPSSVDPSFVNLIDRMVMVRLTVVSAGDSPGEPLYRCSFRSPCRTILRPASDFDFLD